LYVSRILSIITISLALGVSLVLLIQFNPIDDSLQFLENIPWLAPLGLTYRLGVDGLSLPLIVLNNLLTGLALFRSDEAHHRPRLYFTLILFLNVGVTGAFSAQNLLLFFLFYELELIPLYLLIAIWGGLSGDMQPQSF
jgi:NAD(P)H-quinone oxidoreductase subunit 4